MKHIIVTGAYGLVGRNMIASVRKFFDEEVRITKVKFDEIEDLLDGMDKADYIIHAAGYGQPLKFSKDKLATICINTVFVDKLFYYLKPGGTFLFVSTSEVYSGAETPYVETVMGTTTPQHPRACYIEGKRCGEAICMAYKEHGYNVKIARLALAYGATRLGDTRVLNQFIEQGLTGKITLRDSGKAVRTYCYIEDACDLMWKILLKGRDVVYNVGGFSTITIADLAQEIRTLMNATVTIPKDDNGLSDAPGSVCLDMNKTLGEFDQHFTPLRKGLELTINEYLK